MAAGSAEVEAETALADEAATSSAEALMCEAATGTSELAAGAQAAVDGHRVVVQHATSQWKGRGTVPLRVVGRNGRGRCQ